MKSQLNSRANLKNLARACNFAGAGVIMFRGGVKVKFNDY